MKRGFLPILFIVLVLIAGLKTNGQTTASYSYSVLSGTYTSITAIGSTVTGAPSGNIAGPALDQTVQNIPIGFNFTFCGVVYNQISVNNHAFISLANSGTVGAFVNTPANIVGPGVLMAYWFDLGGTGTNGFYVTTGTFPNRVFTVQYTNMQPTPGWTPGSSGLGSFQIKLYETTNVIEYWYGACSLAGTSATIGIANSTTDYHTVNFPGFATATPGGWTATHNVAPSSGTILRWAPCPVTVSATNTGPACPGNPVTLNGVSSGISYVWSGPAGFTSTLLSPTIPSLTAANAGTYTLVASNGTCTMSTTTTVGVSPGPPAFTITPATSVVCGPPQMLTAPPIAPADVTTTYNSTGAFGVPDGSAGGVTNNIAVSGIPGSATIVDVAVKLNNVAMTWDGDLTFGILAPSGANLNLVDRRGGAGDNFINTNISSLGGTGFGAGAPPFTGTFAADATVGTGPTGFFSNVGTWPPLFATPNGNWTLCARDWVATDAATVNS
jgi:hypothetical protein